MPDFDQFPAVAVHEPPQHDFGGFPEAADPAPSFDQFPEASGSSTGFDHFPEAQASSSFDSFPEASPAPIHRQPSTAPRPGLQYLNTPTENGPLWASQAAGEIAQTPGLDAAGRKAVLEKWQSRAQGPITQATYSVGDDPRLHTLKEKSLELATQAGGAIEQGFVAPLSLASPQKVGGDMAARAESLYAPPTIPNTIASGVGGGVKFAAEAMANPVLPIVTSVLGAGGETRSDIAQRRARGESISGAAETVGTTLQSAKSAAEAALQLKLARAVAPVASKLINPFVRNAAVAGMDAAANAGLAVPGQIAGNLIAKTTYDPNRSATEGVGDAAIQGAAVGLALSPITAHHIEQQRHAEVVSKRLGTSKVALAETPVGDAGRNAVAVARAATGQDPIFYKSDSAKAGFIENEGTPESPKYRMYVSADSPEQVGHEAYHGLLRDGLNQPLNREIQRNPEGIKAGADTYRARVQEAATMAEEAGRTEEAQQLHGILERLDRSKAMQTDEGLAVLGNEVLTPEVMDEIRKTNPGLAGRIGERLLGALDKVRGTKVAQERRTERQTKQFIEPLKNNAEAARAKLDAERNQLQIGREERLIDQAEQAGANEPRPPQELPPNPSINPDRLALQDTQNLADKIQGRLDAQDERTRQQKLLEQEHQPIGEQLDEERQNREAASAAEDHSADQDVVARVKANRDAEAQRKRQLRLLQKEHAPLREQTALEQEMQQENADADRLDELHQNREAEAKSDQYADQDVMSRVQARMDAQSESERQQKLLQDEHAPLREQAEIDQENADAEARLQQQKKEEPRDYTPDELAGLPNARVRAIADANGVEADARGTTIPRILEAQRRRQLEAMSNKELYDAAKSKGLRAGNRARNIESLLASEVERPVPTASTEQPRPQAAESVQGQKNKPQQNLTENAVTPAQSPRSVPEPITVHTSIPKEWRGQTLYDWGGPVVLAKGQQLTGDKGRPTRVLPARWHNDLERVRLGKVNEKLIAKVKELAPGEVWKVEGSKGGYVLAPKTALAEARKQVPREFFTPEPKKPVEAATPKEKQQGNITSPESATQEGDLAGGEPPSPAKPNDEVPFSVKPKDEQAKQEWLKKGTDSPWFKAWGRGAPVVKRADAESHDFHDAQPVVVEAFHGAQRVDRIGTRFLKSRATSGPMQYFTSDTEIASNYAKGKPDNSIDAPEDYSGWFKYKPKGSTTEVDLDRAWYHLSPEERQKIASKLPHVVNVDEDGNESDTLRLGGPNEYGLSGKDHWNYMLREAHGNVLKAAKELWLSGGELFDREHEFMDVLRLGGMTGVRYDDPNADHPGVVPTYIRFQKPLVTNDLPDEMIDRLQSAANRQRPPRAVGGADVWDKTNRDPQQWMQQLKEDSANGENSFVWTSIPDWVTRTLKTEGYDGIIDAGGKMGGKSHKVYVPFEPNQIKSATGNRGTFSDNSSDVRFSIKPKEDRADPVTETPEFRKWFGGSKVVDPDGKPKVVYHGTNDSFTTFEHDRPNRKDQGWLGRGFYFTSSPDFAGDYTQLKPGQTGQVMPVHLAIKNPYSATISEKEAGMLAERRGDTLWPERFTRQLKSEGYDGVILDYRKMGMTKENVEYVAFDPNQIKSATGNRGTFSADNPDVRFSILPKRPAPTRGDNIDLSNETLWDTLRRKVQDEFLPIQRMQGDVSRQKGTVTEDSDTYQKANLFKGKAADRIREVQNNFVQPIVQKLTGAKLSAQDLDKYLYALHAPERNAQVAKVNPKMPDGGSGMLNSEAAKVIADVAASGKQAQYDELAGLVHQMNRQTLNRMEAHGLIDSDTADSMRQTYKNYVPLRTDMEADGANLRPGQGFDIRGKDSRRAMGRSTLADSPLTFSLMQAQEKIVRAEKNEVGKSLLKLVRDNPDDKLWSVDEHPTMRTIDPRTGLVRNATDPRFQFADNVVAVKEDGKTHLIEFKGEAGKRLAASVKRLGYSDGGKVVQALGKGMRLYANLQTNKNPEFILPNLARDIQTAAINLSAEQSVGMAARVVKNIPKAAAAVFRVSGDANARMGDEFHDYMREYTRHGGKVDSYALGDFDATQRQLAALLKDANPSKPRRLLLAVRKGSEFIDRLNGATETATRLSAYIEARRGGMSEQSAASLAKNLTVNFNKKGEMGTAINSLYLFANASIQGNARLFKALATTPRGRKIAAGIFGAGLAYSMFAPGMFGKDEQGRDIYDTIPDGIKSTSLAIPTGGKGYLKLPMPYGYSLVFSAGRHMGDLISGRQGAGEAAANLTADAVNTFNPLGSEKTFLQTLSPTALDPFVQYSENKDWTGRAIVPDQPAFGPKKPQSALAQRDTSPYAKSVAQWLNHVTGGDEVTSGNVDISPAAIDHFVGWATGGTGRFLAKSAQLSNRIESGDVPASSLPVAARFMGEAPEMDAREFNDALKKSEDAIADLKHYEQTEQHEKALDLQQSRGKEIGFGRWAEQIKREGAGLRKEMDAAKESGDQEKEKAAKSKMDALMGGFVKAYRSGELPHRWEVENELAALRTRQAAFSHARNQIVEGKGDRPALIQTLKKTKLSDQEQARLKRLSAIHEAVKNIEERVGGGKVSQDTGQRAVDRLLKAA